MSHAGRSDRELQDAVISYLADANLRHTGAAPLPISPEQARRAGKFARFLARRYYRDRLARSFRYSRRFGQAAETVVDTPEFDAFLDGCVLGSVAGAERVGGLAVEYLKSIPAPPPCWLDLLQYERLFFLQAATSENALSAGHPRPAPSARCCHFSWMLPELLPRLKSGAPITQEMCRGVVLLFSRTPRGRIYVVEVDDATAQVFGAADGQRSEAGLSQATSLPLGAVRQAVAALAQVGALVVAP